MANFFRSVGAFARGFATTLGYLFKKPVTQQYPEYVPPVQTRFRGRHLLMRYDNGLERCIGCSLCAIFCPAQAIYVEAAENTDEARFSPGERYAKRYEINMIRCIYCGYCQEACPTEAIVLGHEYAFSEYSREALIYTKEMLLVPDPRPADARPVPAGAGAD
jgi:NADH-quinone oxidoreductase subunit I